MVLIIVLGQNFHIILKTNLRREIIFKNLLSQWSKSAKSHGKGY